MTKLKPYVLTWQGGALADGKKRKTRIIVFGPFTSTAEAEKWGESWQECNGDDPRWQVISLSKKRIGTNTLLVPVIKAYFGG